MNQWTTKRKGSSSYRITVLVYPCTLYGTAICSVVEDHVAIEAATNLLLYSNYCVTLNACLLLIGLLYIPSNYNISN